MVEEYVRNCQNAGVELCDWRERLGFEPMQCGVNSQYYGCSSDCVDTCFTTLVPKSAQ